MQPRMGLFCASESGKHGESAFAQVQGIYLVECGTHAVVDAGFWPCLTSERPPAVVASCVRWPSMLVMWDRGFHDFDLVAQAHATGAEVLTRPATSS